MQSCLFQSATAQSPTKKIIDKILIMHPSLLDNPVAEIKDNQIQKSSYPSADMELMTILLTGYVIKRVISLDQVNELISSVGDLWLLKNILPGQLKLKKDNLKECEEKL